MLPAATVVLVVVLSTVGPGGSGVAVAAAPRATFTPVAWYRFEDLHNASVDSGGTGAFPLHSEWNATHHPTSVNVPAPATHGPVGNYLTFTAEANATVVTNWGAKAPIAITEDWRGFTLEFLIKPGPRFTRGGYSNLFTSSGASGLPSIDLKFLGGELVFSARTAGATGGGTPADVLELPFNGQGVLAYDYLMGARSGWHHVALVKDCASGNQSVWIDGQSYGSMRRVGNATGAHMLPAAFGLEIDAKNAVGLDASVDEVAVYDTALPGSLIHLHWAQTLNSSTKVGVPYTFDDPGGVAPPPPVYPTTNDSCVNASWCYWDLLEYPTGTELPSPFGENNTVGGDVPCVWQMEYYPGPRYNATAATTYGTPYNFNWMDPHYMAGATDPITKRFNVELTVELMQTMADRWRYGPMMWSIPRSTSGFVPTADQNLSLALFNAHPEWPLNTILPFGAEFRNHTLPKGCYLQNAAGDFITVAGDVSTSKSLRPMSESLAMAQGCPDSLWAKEGLAVAASLKQLAPYLTRPFDNLNLDGEVFVSLDTPGEDYNFSHDPTVLADFKASGAPNWITYWSEWRVRLTQAATTPYLTDPTLSTGLLKGARLTMYQVQGDNPYFGNWTVTRKIMTPVSTGRGGPPTYQSTVDLYMQSPREWWGGGGPDHGMQWLELTRRSEIADGDVLNSPFVSCGWSGKVEHNIRPGQWLGLLKIISTWGAEFFYTGFFNVKVDSHGQMPVSGQWCWQGMMPAFAQAVLLSQAADFFYRGDLIMADANTTAGVSGKTPSPWLWAGQPNILAVARRVDGAVLLTLAIQKSSNAAHNVASYTVLASVGIPGLPTPLSVTARLQGSVYVYRNDTAQPTPVLYQLDGWHEATHPSYWPTQSRQIEAEVFEGHLTRSHAEALCTELGVDAASATDFGAFTTYVDLSTAARQDIGVMYNLSHHGGGGSIRVRARSGVVTAAGFASPCHPVETNRTGWSWLDLTSCGEVPFNAALILRGTAHVDRIEVS